MESILIGLFCFATVILFLIGLYILVKLSTEIIRVIEIKTKKS